MALLAVMIRDRRHVQEVLRILEQLSGETVLCQQHTFFAYGVQEEVVPWAQETFSSLYEQEAFLAEGVPPDAVPVAALETVKEYAHRYDIDCYTRENWKSPEQNYLVICRHSTGKPQLAMQYPTSPVHCAQAIRWIQQSRNEEYE
jgi:hypothetical protein